MSLARSPALAAVLSFVVPGLGQLSLGSVRRGVLISLPAIGIFLAAVVLRLAGGWPIRPSSAACASEEQAVARHQHQP